MANKVTVDVSGLQAVIEKFVRRGRDLSPQLEVIGEDIIAAVQENFTSGKFQPLAASTVRFKLRHGKSAKPLIFDGTWRREHFKIVGPGKLVVKTTVPYAVFHVSDAPREKIPLRNPYDLNPKVLADAKKRLAKFIASGTVT